MTWHNLLRIYQKYIQTSEPNFSDNASADTGDTDRQFDSLMNEERSKSNSNGSFMQDEANRFQKKKALQEQYHMLFQSMVEIIDVIAE